MDSITNTSEEQKYHEMATAVESLAELDSWKEAYTHLSIAILRTKRSIAAEKAKMRFMLCEVIDNIDVDGNFIQPENSIVGVPWSVRKENLVLAAQSQTQNNRGKRGNKDNTINKQPRKRGRIQKGNKKKISQINQKDNDTLRSNPKIDQQQRSQEEINAEVRSRCMEEQDCEATPLSFQKMVSSSVASAQKSGKTYVHNVGKNSVLTSTSTISKEEDKLHLNQQRSPLITSLPPFLPK